MPLYKLINALPQSAPGNQETHYGHMCEVRKDGIYCDFSKELGDLFVSVGRCYETDDFAETSAKTVVEVVENTIEPVAKVIETIIETTVTEPVIETQDIVETDDITETVKTVAEKDTIVALSATTTEILKKVGRPKAVK